MIKRIEAKNYRSLKYIDQSLDNIHVLIGPNASGKTTFLDVVTFLAEIMRFGIDQAIQNRSSNYQDLTFSAIGGDIELAIEVLLEPSIQKKLENKFDIIRYEIRFGLLDVTMEHAIKEERVLLINSKLISEYNINKVYQRSLFPEIKSEPKSILNKRYAGSSGKAYKLIIRKKPEGNDNFYVENLKSTSSGWLPSFKFGLKKSALANVPADATRFPASSWLKDFLLDGVQTFVLDSSKIREASPPGQLKKFKSDGSNLPWVINDLMQDKLRFRNWIQHIQTALPDVENIEIVEREDDKHKYLKIIYSSGIKVPSWLVSDGTLRLLALTIPAYLVDFFGVYLIEEPENGIHPKAVETVYQSLASVYNAQIMLASHSPVILSLVSKKEVLCFAKTDDGATDIVKGSEHPIFLDWKGESDLSTLFASGILG